MPWSAPGPWMRDYVGAVKAVWNHWQTKAPLDFRSAHYTLNLTTPLFDPGPIEHPEIPIHLAAVNTHMCQVAGEVADGVRPHPICSAEYIANVMIPEVRKGAEKVGRSLEHFSICHKPLIATAATEAELEAALDAAQVGPLVRSLPDGLDTLVGDRGYRLSGGEKQRMAIARLLLKAPGIVVLDEATAHLDSESEAAVQRALSTALQGRTSLVIAHRLSTVREADQILVIEAGRIVERGRHDELLERGGLYTELYRRQFAAQENEPALD